MFFLQVVCPLNGLQLRVGMNFLRNSISTKHLTTTSNKQSHTQLMHKIFTVASKL
jgi:hypothetical protein